MKSLSLIIMCYLVTRDHPENQGSCGWLFLEDGYTHSIRFIDTVMCKFTSFSVAIPEHSAFISAAFSSAACLQEKLYSDTWPLRRSEKVGCKRPGVTSWGNPGITNNLSRLLCLDWPERKRFRDRE